MKNFTLSLLSKHEQMCPLATTWLGPVSYIRAFENSDTRGSE